MAQHGADQKAIVQHRAIRKLERLGRLRLLMAVRTAVQPLIIFFHTLHAADHLILPLL